MGGSEVGVQGMTELIECERCDDIWLQELQNQFRHGRFSKDMHRLLHNKPTRVPISWEIVMWHVAISDAENWQEPTARKSGNESQR